MAKLALLIGVSEYEPGLTPLPGTLLDVDALQRVLVNPEMGGFAAADITVLKNPVRQVMEEAIYRLFSDRQRDDLLLLYFSGHGVKTENGRLYLATRETRKENGRLFNPSAVAATYLHERINESRSQRQVIILDCCYSGAIAQGMTVKDDGTLNLQTALGGKGRAILTSSTSVEYSFGAEAPGYDDNGLSVYTRYLVEGIETGAADADDDGLISVEELHTYASGRVRDAAPAMTPKFYPVEEGYKIIVAKSPKDDSRLKYRKAVKQRAHQGKFTIPARRLLNSLRLQFGLTSDVAEAIEAEELQPYREYQRKLQDYEQTVIDALKDENPLSPRTLNDLKDYQQHLALLDTDVAPIGARHLGKILETPSVESIASLESPHFKFEVVTVNLEGKEINRRPGRAEYFVEDLGEGVTLDLVKIPAGEFLMGSPDSEAGRNADESPQHRVRVPGFYMGRYAVTQAQWSQVVGLPKVNLDLQADPSRFKGANRPVEQVSWDDAVEFCARLSAKTKMLYRLPSEAEWEYACRAGTTTPFHIGETITTDLANYDGNHTYGNAPKGQYREKTTDVGSFLPNGFGLHDMHGNVWEWCLDHWHDNYQGAPTDGSAWVTGENDVGTATLEEGHRVLRGGSWFNSPGGCRSACRHPCEPGVRLLNYGFRVVCLPARTLS